MYALLGKFGAGDAESGPCPQGGVILQNSHPLLSYVTDPTPSQRFYMCPLI